jgi:hypothetical protein
MSVARRPLTPEPADDDDDVSWLYVILRITVAQSTI